MTKQAAAALSATDGQKNAPSGVRSPHRPEHVLHAFGHGRHSLFMENTLHCSACRTIAALGGASYPRRLHVVLDGNGIIITDADDLHSPGVSLAGERILVGDKAEVFRLLATAPKWAKFARQASATGVAVLAWGNGRRSLKVFGAANGLPTFHDTLVDAVELSPSHV